jgi:hypothetical protein
VIFVMIVILKCFWSGTPPVIPSSYSNPFSAVKKGMGQFWLVRPLANLGIWSFSAMLVKRCIEKMLKKRRG